MTADAIVLRLFLQMAVILAACRVLGRIGRRLGQTQVVSEMVAGVVLGPSLLGLLAPGLQEWLFPTRVAAEGAAAGSVHPSMIVLYAISQIGLVLYMFIVGLEFDGGLLRGRARSAGLVSGAGVLVPFGLGAVMTWGLHGRLDLFHQDVPVSSSALFLGASMSITAFPMLARILDEKGLARTRLGAMTLAAGSIDDAFAWCLLAVVMSTLKGSWVIAALALGGGALYAVCMVTLGRRLFDGFARRTERHGGLTTETMASALVALMLAAWFTDAIGIFAVFGAFVAGVAMPRGRFAQEMRLRTEWLTVTFLLPVFFVYSGLGTRIGLLDSPQLWVVAAIVLAAAVAGKGVACAAAARLAGERWREAAAIGTLMNARGLMELIILNIGLREGIVTPTLFTILVLMAVVTTLMTSPIFQIVYGRQLPPLAATRSGRVG